MHFQLTHNWDLRNWEWGECGHIIKARGCRLDQPQKKETDTPIKGIKSILCDGQKWSAAETSTPCGWNREENSSVFVVFNSNLGNLLFLSFHSKDYAHTPWDCKRHMLSKQHSCRLSSVNFFFWISTFFLPKSTFFPLFLLL